MAATRIIPLHLNKGKTLVQCLGDRTDYAKNPEKTDKGNFISSFACDPDFVASEFALSKKRYHDITGRYQENDVIAYQVRQSFKPGEVTPEEANRIGYEFAERFLKGEHAFIVCTHTDKTHIHNHIIWNSTALDCTRKFRNFWGSTEAVRKLSDLVCTEHRLSVIENPARHGMSYNKWLGEESRLSGRDMLRMAIDQAIQKNPDGMDELIKLLEESGYTVKRGKHLSFRAEGQKKFIRLRSLGDGYSEENLQAVLKKEKPHTPFTKKYYPKGQQRTTLISELEAKINSGKGIWYDQAMKVLKLKQMAKTFVYIDEHGYDDVGKLYTAAAEAESRVNVLKERIKTAENRMVEIQTLKTHIINYAKTNEIWTGYRKSGYSKKYLAEHEGDIILHRAAKKVFDESGLKKIPTVKSLNEEFSKLLADKKEAYAEYNKVKAESRELMIHKANVEYILRSDEQKDQVKGIHYE